MLRYTLRRLVEMVPILLGVAILIFFFVRAIPGDPARAVAGLDASPSDIALIRKDLGLDQPWPVQFWRFGTGLLHGDLGRSVLNHHPVNQLIGKAVWPSAQLALAAMAVALGLGLAAGVLAAVRRDSLFDYVSMVLATAGISLPSFWLAWLLMGTFAVRWRLLPTSGYGGLRHLVLPAITLGLAAAGGIARFTRNSLLAVIGHDYVRTARARGVPGARVVLRHALKNALIPVVTCAGLQFGFLPGGSVIAETVFSWPGLGSLLISAVGSRDYPLVQGLMLLFALEFLALNLAVDLAYAAIDPRIAYAWGLYEQSDIRPSRPRSLSSNHARWDTADQLAYSGFGAWRNGAPVMLAAGACCALDGEPLPGVVGGGCRPAPGGRPRQKAYHAPPIAAVGARRHTAACAGRRPRPASRMRAEYRPRRQGPAGVATRRDCGAPRERHFLHGRSHPASCKN